MLNFEWDEKKAIANAKKHGITFQEATTVFNDQLAISFHDPDNSAGESRMLTFGISELSRVLLVVHTERAANIRIISARKATKQERKIYEQG